MQHNPRVRVYKKDKKIVILKESEQTGACVDVDPPLIPIHSGKLWAYFRHLSGDEIFASRATEYTEEVLFIINWRKGIEPGFIVWYKGKHYEIVRIDNYEDYKSDIKLYCKLVRDREEVEPEPESAEID